MNTEKEQEKEHIFHAKDLNIYYGTHHAVSNINLDIYSKEITAFIGPSGCGKSSVLRCYNRMNDLIPTAKVTGTLQYKGVDLYDSQVDPVEVRRHIGMVFQKPNPFPKSIYDNVAYGPRVCQIAKNKEELDDIVERSIKQAALWDEVKGRLKESAFSLSGGQQQRLCIARTLAINPDVLLMDEPCSSLDPIATTRIEELMDRLKDKYTIIIVTHNMQQAARISDKTAFFTSLENSETGERTGELIEFDNAETIFSNPSDERTEGYITGRFG